MIIDVERVEFFARCATCDCTFLESAEKVKKLLLELKPCICISCDPGALEISCLKVTEKGLAEVA